MKLIPGDAHEWSDAEVRQVLRAHYTAPSGDSYWSSLERRIMERVGSDGVREWWTYFPEWVRFGLAAAAAVVLVAGVVSWQTSARETNMAYEEIIGTPIELPVLTETINAVPRTQRQQTLRYLLSR